MLFMHFSCTWYFPRNIHSRGASCRSLLQTSVHFPSYQSSFVGSIGRRTTFLKVFCIHLYSLQLRQRDLVLRSRIVSLLVSFLKLKLLIQCIELTYFFTNDPKSLCSHSFFFQLEVVYID